MYELVCSFRESYYWRNNMTKYKHKTEGLAPQKFKQEFFALLRKYNAEMYIRENNRRCNGGVSFEFDDCSFIDLSSFEDGKEFV